MARPGLSSGRFIEVEDASGRSIRFGQWIQRSDGRWVLRITPDDFENVRSVDTREVQAALDRASERVRREGPGVVDSRRAFRSAHRPDATRVSLSSPFVAPCEPTLRDRLPKGEGVSAISTIKLDRNLIGG